MEIEYLFPTAEEFEFMQRELDPTERLFDYLYAMPPTPGSMAEFFLESQDHEAFDWYDEDGEDVNLGKKVSWNEI
jgi:hypothetical protein